MAPHQQDWQDPFGEEKAPSLSFKDAPIGTMYKGIIARKAKMVQMRDFESGQPKTWPDGNPVMGAVLLLEVDGELRSLWAQKPSSMFAALVQAQKEAGGNPMEEGGTLYVKFVGTEPNKKNPKLNAAKQYAAKYEPPVVSKTDPFVDHQPPTQPAQQSAQQPTNVNTGWGKPATSSTAKW